MPHAGALRILQFSDVHLYAGSDETFRDVNPDAALARLLDTALQGPPADAALLTGDLVHDGSEEGYHRIRAHFARLGIPVHCLVGNHDDGAAMRRVLAAGPVAVGRVALFAHWQLILLDSTVPGRCAGHLGAEELAWLRRCLAAHPSRYALIALHHPPLPCGSRWMDEDMLLDNPGELFAAIAGAPAVRAVVWGHIHQEFGVVRGGVRYLAAPATSVQFTPGTEVLAIDDLQPGCRWFTLYPDGVLATGILRAPPPPSGTGRA